MLRFKLETSTMLDGGIIIKSRGHIAITIGVYLISALISLKAFSLADEPQWISPEQNPTLIRSFNLDNAPENWNDPVIKLLIVGRDSPMALP